MRIALILFIVFLGHACASMRQQHKTKMQIHTFLDDLAHAFEDGDTIKLKQHMNKEVYEEFSERTSGFTERLQKFEYCFGNSKRRVDADNTGAIVFLGKRSAVLGYSCGRYYIYKILDNWVIVKHFPAQ